MNIFCYFFQATPSNYHGLSWAQITLVVLGHHIQYWGSNSGQKHANSLSIVQCLWPTWAFLHKWPVNEEWTISFIADLGASNIKEPKLMLWLLFFFFIHQSLIYLICLRLITLKPNKPLPGIH